MRWRSLPCTGRRLGCLRNALEVLTVGAGLAVTKNAALFGRWRNGHEVKFGNARDMLKDSTEGRRVDQLAAPATVFNQRVPGAWLDRLHGRLCGYAHSRAGFNNMDFWESNGPVHVWESSTGSSPRHARPWFSAWCCCASDSLGFTMTPEARETVANVDASWQDMAPIVNAFLADGRDTRSLACTSMWLDLGKILGRPEVDRLAADVDDANVSEKLLCWRYSAERFELCDAGRCSPNSRTSWPPEPSRP
jgi:hypothetical protein